MAATLRTVSSHVKTDRLVSGKLVAMPANQPDPTRRNEASRRAILAAAIDLIGERGYDHVSVEAIARRAGVGKQTIYRWWPSKGAVALEALNDSLATVVDFPDSGDIVEDLRTQMKGVVQLLGSTEVGRVYQGLLAAAQSDSSLSRAHLEQIIEPANVACHARIARAQDRGEIRADADRQLMIDLLYGAIYYRLLLHTRPLESEQIDAALDIAFRGLRAEEECAP
jgi:AcrR family transcriptional regulator